MATKEYTNLSPIKALIKPNEVTKKVSSSNLLLICGLFLLILALLTAFRSFILNDSLIYSFIGVFIGMPIILLLTYSPIYLFISALEKHSKIFFISFLVFSSYVLPLVILGHLLVLIPFQRLLEFLLVIFMVILFTVIIRNLKAYFNTTTARSATAVVLWFILITVISFPVYLVMFLQQLQGW